MILSGSSDIIKKCEYFATGTQARTQWLDELGNGLMELVDLIEGNCLELSEQGFVSEYRAGFVGLKDDKVILITPNDIQLFASKADALRNQNELARLQLA